MTEDYPPGEETIFRSGDRILAVGDTSVRGMSPESFQELLEVNVHSIFCTCPCSSVGRALAWEVRSLGFKSHLRQLIFP